MATQKRKAVILDCDDTASETGRHGKPSAMPKEMEEAIRKLIAAGFLVTFNTTRDPIEMLAVLGEKWEEIISPELYIGFESGGRLGRFMNSPHGVTYDDKQVNPLSFEEIEQIIGMLEANPKSTIKFYSGKFSRGQFVWTADADMAGYCAKKYSLCSEILRMPAKKFKEVLLEFRPVYFSIRSVENIPQQLNILKSSSKLGINTSLINKASTLHFFAEECGIDLKSSIVAGDSSVDAPVLQTEEIGTRFIVGHNGHFKNEKGVHHVKDARELGIELLKIADEVKMETE
jgi:hydroxymethylpyrimidine pyrophosphatase-like HAD family hydrolase